MSLVSLPAGDVFVPVTIEENDIINGISKVLSFIRPEWPEKSILYKTFTDGITNKLVACQLSADADETKSGDNIVLVRIYGNKTDLLIDRSAEIRNIKTLNVYGLAPKIYGVFENGLAYQYYPGVTLDVDSVIDIKIWPLVAQQMARMHKVNLSKEIKKEPILWNKIEQFLSLLPEPFTAPQKHERFVNAFGSITRLRIESERLKSYLSKVESPIVFAHNDLLLGNVIYNESKGTVSFIDYEYASYNYQAFDIANHFNEFVGLDLDQINYDEKFPNKTFQMSWIEAYLAEYNNISAPSSQDIEKLYKEVQCFALASHFMWGVWSYVQFELSNIDFDFGKYGEIRLNRYYELKDKVYKELS